MNARFLILLLTLSISFNALAQDNQRFENIEITTTKITEGIYMLAGDGGNMGVSIGKDGVFLIDDQYAPLTDKIVNAIGKISDDKIHFVFNTHYHDDHTGGNENLGKMGIDIVAHDDVYNRLSNGQHKENITPDEIQTIEDGLPIISYNDTLTFHMNDIEITTKHYAHAQTDSDSVIYFEGKNVIHMGDIFENSGYPYVDIDAGGAFIGIISAVEDTLKHIDDQTVIIPGHGSLSNKRTLEKYSLVLKDIYKILEPLALQGMLIEDVIKLSPLKKYDIDWGAGDIRPETFLKLTYQSILNSLKKAD